MLLWTLLTVAASEHDLLKVSMLQTGIHLVAGTGQRVSWSEARVVRRLPSLFSAVHLGFCLLLPPDSEDRRSLNATALPRDQVYNVPWQ